MAQATSMPIRDDVRQKRRRGGRDADQRIFIAATLIPTALGLFIFSIYPLRPVCAMPSTNLRWAKM